MNNEKTYESIDKVLEKNSFSGGLYVAAFGVIIPTIIFILSFKTQLLNIALDHAHIMEPALITAIQEDALTDATIDGFSDVLASVSGFDSIVYAGLYDDTGRILSRWQRPGFEKFSNLALPEGDVYTSGTTIFGNYLVKEPNTNANYRLLIGISTIQYFKSSAFIYVVGMAIVLIIAFFAIIAVWKYFHFSIIVPIVNLSNKADEFLKTGDLSIRLPMTEDNEIGELASNINSIFDNIKSLLGNIKINFVQLNTIDESLNSTWSTLADYSEQITTHAKANGNNIQQLVTAYYAVAKKLEELSGQSENEATTIHEMAQINQESIVQIDEMDLAVKNSISVLEQLNHDIQQIAFNVSSLQQSTTTAVTSMQNISNAIADEEQNNQEYMYLAKKLAIDAGKGQGSIDKACEGIFKIQSTTQQVSRAITVLNEHAVEIGSIISIIDEVSKQTSLLALNADIIAVQAGEHGRGFDIVAQELANLATSTETAARDISVLIQEIQAAGKEAVETMNSEQEYIDIAVQSAKENSMIFNVIQAISGHAAEQAQSIAKEAFQQASLVQSAASNMEGIAQSIQDINTLSQAQVNDANVLSSAAVQMQQLTANVGNSAKLQTQSSQKVMANVTDIAQTVNDTRKQQFAQGEATKSALNDLKGMGAFIVGQRQEAAQLSKIVDDVSKQISELNHYIEDYKL